MVVHRFLIVILLMPLLLFAQNYDESKVPSYQLPKLLLTNGGEQINNASQWENLRRPEIIKLFETEVYGVIPKKFDAISFELKREKKVMDGIAKLKLINIIVTNNGLKDSLTLTLLIPIGKKKPCPVMVLINNRDNSNTDYDRKIKSDFWPAELLINNGYAIAAFQVSDLAPDDKANFATRFLRLFPNEFKSGTRTISAWAFGASRVMDYLVTDKDIDNKRVGLVGHSRGGKTALWAVANDQRFSLCIANCSGNSGAALARRQFGQTIAMINNSFPHWFSPKYKNYNDREADLPLDQHMLISLIAPKPVYITAATEDRWADPKGMYLALSSAQQVYQLYGKFRELPLVFPVADHQVSAGNLLAFHNRTGKHDLKLYDWQNFISFAKSYWR